jgi:4-alpha-glucanotransferase
VPTGSYAEMGEWALPPDESREFGEALRAARETRPREIRWLRGAFWRNFQVKYREVNDLHKQMLRASTKVEAMAPGVAQEAALDHLYRGQSNDCYWHGLFGGIYIAHMRAATLAHLIAAEDLADAAAGRQGASEIRDLDLDGRDELRLATAGQVVVIDLDEGGGIGSWDLRAARHALTGVLRRRPEAYHQTLRRHEAAARNAAAGDGGADANGITPPEAADETGGPASIHEIVQVKEAGLADRLVYDDFERRSGVIRILPAGSTAATWAGGGRGDLGDFVDGPFTVSEAHDSRVTVARDGHASVDGVAFPLWVETQLRLGGGRLDPTLEQRMTLENRGAAVLEARIGVEWAMTMLGGGGNPEAYWEIDGKRGSHDGSGADLGVEVVAQGNGWLGVEVATTVDPVADAWHAPIDTVSNSEAGFERVYQGSALLLSWPVSLAPGERWTATVRHAATIAVDRAASDVGPA